MPIKNAFLYRSTELISQKNRPCVSTRAVNFPHESKSPPTPLQKGGSVFGISSGRVSSFTVKKSGVFFSPPFLKGGGGDLLFITHPNAHKKNRPCVSQGRFIFQPTLLSRRSAEQHCPPYLAFRMKANPPPNPPSKRGSVFGISSGRVSSFTVKKIRCFFSPLF